MSDAIMARMPGATMAGRGPAAQRGVVLLFTLIALVAMTLAALAMVRSAETTNLVAGNVALKQGAVQEADNIMNVAFTCLDNGGPLLAVNLDNENTCSVTIAGKTYTGKYYPLTQVDQKAPFGTPDLLDSASGTTDATTQNKSAFVIERLCTDPANPIPRPTTFAWDTATCIESPFGRAPNILSTPKPGSPPPPQALYRISIKVSGALNPYGKPRVVTYSQMILNAGL